MTSDRHEAAKQRIKKAFWQIRQRPDLVGLGPMFDRIKDVEHAPIPTCATDGKKFFYSTEFVESLHQSVLRTVAMHEAMHVGHAHHLRLRNLLERAGIDVDQVDAHKAPESVRRRVSRIAGRANEAMDHVINNQITQSEAFRSGFLAPPPGDMWCCDPKYADQTKWSFDRVFSDLGGIPPEEPESQDEDKEPTLIPQKGEGDGADEDENGGKLASPKDKGEDEDEDGDAPAKGEGEDEDEDEDEGGDKAESGDGSGGDTRGSHEKESDTSGPGYKPVGGMGEVMPSPAETKEDQQQEYEDIHEDLARGEFMEKCMGSGRGTNKVLKTLRNTSGEQPSEWGWMKDLLSDAYAEERTWAKPNLYHMDHGYLPGRDKTSGDLVVWCDMSGSMSTYELEVCRAELEHIAMDLGVSTIHLGYFSGGPIQTEAMAKADTYFTEIEVGSGDPVEFEVVGRAGTEFDPCLRATEESGLDVQAMVVFTDGEVWIREDAPQYPVIWATTNQEPEFRTRTYEPREGWGEVVKLNIDTSKMEYW